jgi:DNA end-binding protein Ku
MRNTGTLGIGTITMRKRQYLASIKAHGDAIVLDLMRFADEVLEPTEYRLPDAKGIRPQELKMAEQLVQSLTDDFHPEKYHDQYRDNLERIINGKMKGKTVRLTEAAEPEMTGVIDLVERLEASLKKGGAKPARKSSKSGGRKRKTA